MSNSHQNKPSFSFGRRLGVGFNVLLACLAVLALVAMANYLSSRHYKRVHLKSNADYTLSPRTIEVLNALTDQVRVVVFFDPDERLYSHVSILIDEYRHASPRLLVETVDYIRNPANAELIKAKYNLVNERDLVIFECNGRTKFVSAQELSEYDFTPLMSGESKEVKRVGFKGELMFTSAIISVTSARQPKAYFLQGHGEHDPTEDRHETGYAKFVEVLKESNIQASSLTLMGTNDIPEDCQLLIIAGPKDAFLQPELEKIDRYLGQGGRLFALFNFHSRTGLESYFGRWGIEIGNNVVLDKQNTIRGRDLVTSFEFGNHPIVRPLGQAQRPLHLVLPRSVSKVEAGRPNPDAPQVVELAFSNPEAWARYDIRNGVIYENPFRDRQGKIPLIVAVEKGNIPGVSLEKGSTRMVIAGDSFFLDNEMIPSASNRDFASLAANWLLDRSHLLGGIGPRPITEYRFILTQAQLRTVRWILLGAFPGAALFVGLLVWMRRRR